MVGIAALPPGLAEQARRWTRCSSGSLLPLSGMAATPVGRQVTFLDRSGLAVYTKPLLGLDRQVFGRPLVFERRLWGNTGSGSWTRRSLPLLSRWGSLHDVDVDQRSRQPLAGSDGVSDMRRRPVS